MAESLTESPDPDVRRAALALRQAQTDAADSAAGWARTIDALQEELAVALRRVNRDSDELD